MAVLMVILRGATFDLQVEEVNERDIEGRVLLYVASIYKQHRGSAKRCLLRRSRLPGAAAEMAREIRLRGVSAF